MGGLNDISAELYSLLLGQTLESSDTIYDLGKRQHKATTYDSTQPQYNRDTTYDSGKSWQKKRSVFEYFAIIPHSNPLTFTHVLKPSEIQTILIFVSTLHLKHTCHFFPGHAVPTLWNAVNSNTRSRILVWKLSSPTVCTFVTGKWWDSWFLRAMLQHCQHACHLPQLCGLVQ